VSSVKKNIATCIIIGLFLVVIALLLYPIMKHRPRWVEIQDPNKLVAECEELLEHIGEIELGRYREIPEDKWPDSIRLLNATAKFPKPVFVSVVIKDCVMITLHSGGIGPARGYLVYPDRRTKTVIPSGLVNHGCIHPGIFRYKTDEGKTRVVK